MNELVARQFMIIEQLEKELQNQKGMLWLLGEIMKVANNIDSFKSLMNLLTDMLMGVTGVNTCYIWVGDEEELKVYLRSTSLYNEFLEIIDGEVPEGIQQVASTLLIENEQIDFALIPNQELPKSRLIVPLINFNDDSIIGGMILEQEQPGFFTTHNTVFFETLGTFIACNARNSKMYEQIAEESERDPLTGAYNRRYLVKLLDKYAVEYDQLSIAVIDTDNFKSVNDILGHLIGDEVLKVIAKGAKKSFAPYGGKVIRYGGDEFVIVIPKNLNECIEIYQEFQESIPDMPVISEIEVPVTITMGICGYPEMNVAKERLLQTADNALLRGKAEGKNRVILAGKEDWDQKCIR